MSEGEETSGSDTGIGEEPVTRNASSGASDLFKTVLDDYFLEQGRISKAEFDRYKSKKNDKTVQSEEHTSSARCSTCKVVLTRCKCNIDITDAGESSSSQRVHWADEVWDKPLITYLGDIEDTSDDVDGHFEETNIQLKGVTIPKPILKHKATCIVIVSD